MYTNYLFDFLHFKKLNSNRYDTMVTIFEALEM